MSCPSDGDRLFGPRINTQCRSFDFTMMFEDIVFACLPSAIFLCLSPLNIAALLRQPCIRPTWSRLLASKMVVLSGIFARQLAFLALRLRNDTVQTPASLAADVLTFFSTAMALALSFLDHRRSLRPSTLFALYLSATSILGIARARTLWIIGTENHVPGTFIASLSLTGVALLLESIQTQTEAIKEKTDYTPEQYSGIWNRSIFAWLAKTFWTGYNNVISVNDLPALDRKLKTDKLHRRLVSTWSRYNHQDRRSLLRACCRAFLLSFLSAVIPRIALTAFTFMQAFLLNSTVTFVSRPHPDRTYGQGLIGAWALVFVGIAISNSIYQYQNRRFATRVRGALMAIVYQRSLETRQSEQGKITAVSLMGADIERIAMSFKIIHEVWASLLDVAVATWLLERKLSLACLAPACLVGVFIAITSRLSVQSNTAQRKWIEKVQERIRVTSASLDGIKAVKMLGLTQKVTGSIQSLRKDEIATSSMFRKVLVKIILLSNAPITLAPTVTFAIYVIISLYWKGQSLEVAQAFTSLALIALLTEPVVVFTQALPQVTQSLACFDRIQEYCNYSSTTDCTEPQSHNRAGDEESMNEEAVELVHSSLRNSPISIEKQTYRWTTSGAEILKDLTFTAVPQSLTVLVGPVGSGKSSLLGSILNEMIGASPDSKKASSQFAYCSQEPWLENRTIRDNIIGANPFDDKWYGTVKACCDIETDIQRLTDGDDTRVGSKGVKLSGGQKQRIALTRAVYSRCSTVLLDDIFSGMDRRTIDTISRRLLGREGLFRRQRTTVVLVTNNSKIMALADSVSVLQNGTVVETSTPATLSKQSISIDTVSEEELSEQELDAEQTKIAPTAVQKTAPKSDADKWRKNGELSVYKYYVASGGYWLAIQYLLSMALWLVLAEVSTIWLKWWSEDNATHPNHRVGMYMGVYATFGIVGTLGACLGGITIFLRVIPNTAERLHSDLLNSALKAPYWFFSNTDTGELMNRFSQDMELIDMQLPAMVSNYFSTALSCIAKVVILLIFSKYLAAAVPILGTVLYFLQMFYLQTSRQVRLLGIEAKAPLYTHFMDSVAGAATIRAYGWQRSYEQRVYRFVDASQRPDYMQGCIQTWLTFVLDSIVAGLAVVLVAVVVTWHDKFSAGSVGVSLVMIIGFSLTLSRLITSWTRMESSIGAVARVKRFIAETEPEDIDGKLAQIEPAWPHYGKLEVKHLSASHQPNGDIVVNDISLSVEPGQHIAMCGRSGSGKTSLLLSVLRMMNIQKGQIMIDGIDISTVNGEDLRSHINVVPQDPFFMPGSVRTNIDPFGTAMDTDIERALQRVGLWDLVSSDKGLDDETDFSTWSTGQRQLFCLARAMIKQSKILLLDEAMSSVDSQTESVMQDIIDTDFKHHTVLAIMHRLEHIKKYSKVALIDNSRLIAFDEPAKVAIDNTWLA